MTLRRVGTVRWERKFGAVYAKSLVGVPRVELYKDEKDYDRGKNVKYLLLQNCITVRLVHKIKKDEYFLKLQMKDIQFSLMSDFPENLKLWQNAICLAAFQQSSYDVSPSSENYPPSVSSVFQSKSECDSSTVPEESCGTNYDVPWDVRGTKVSIITTVGSEQLFTLHNAYFINTGKDALCISPEDRLAGDKICFEYSTIDW
ncbi:unnamed protein product [Soboliphyme baturini]|uniref:PH domain-containing protein n=1 Tax=Soboliphyme baturini TaxID=241478 RepID=A0A183J2X4_9BILA|nr:unnamed protein product [Soboliphyme baturini]